MSDSTCNLQGPMHGFSCCGSANNSSDGERNIQKSEIIISVTPTVSTFFPLSQNSRKHLYIIQPLLITTFQLQMKI